MGGSAYVSCDAEISACGRYRYVLHRVWGEGPVVCWVMLNPSTADASVDDATIRRCVGFSRRWGYGAMRVVNLFAYRATWPGELVKHYPVGRREVAKNDARILRWSEGCDVVLAWGNHGDLLGRDREVIELLADRRLYCLGMTGEGRPRHPVRLAGSTELVGVSRVRRGRRTAKSRRREDIAKNTAEHG